MFSRAFDLAVPQATKRYGTARKIMDRENTSRALEQLTDRSRLLSARLTAIDACLSGETTSCAPSDLSLRIPPSATAMPLPTEAIERAQDARAFYGQLGFDVEMFPMTVLDESVCVHPEQTPPLFTLSPLVDPYGYIDRFGIVPLGNIRFFSPGTRTNIPYLDFFVERGAQFVPAKEFNHYNCPEMQRDVSRIFSLYGARWFVANAALFRLPQSPEYEEYVSAGGALQGGIVYEADAARFMSTAAALIESGTLPAHFGNPLTDLIIGYRDGSAGFEWTPTEIARIESRNLFAMGNGAHPELSAAFLYFARSGIFSLLMSDNASLGASYDFFEHKPSLLPSEPYTYFSDFSDDPAKRSRAVSDMQQYLQVHYEPL